MIPLPSAGTSGHPHAVPSRRRGEAETQRAAVLVLAGGVRSGALSAAERKGGERPHVRAPPHAGDRAVCLPYTLDKID